MSTIRIKGMNVADLINRRYDVAQGEAVTHRWSCKLQSYNDTLIVTQIYVSVENYPKYIAEEQKIQFPTCKRLGQIFDGVMLQ